MKRYEAVVHELGELIRGGSLKPGERLPSIRDLSRARKVSASTILHAYERLEADGLIESRPRSGYYVTARRQPTQAPTTPKGRALSTRVAVSDLVFETLEASRNREVVPLGSAFPSPLQFPWAKLARYLGSGARHMDPWSTVESLPPGNPDLRREIARRYLRLGMSVGIEQIVITAGALEALNLSLQTVTRAGDTIAIESPAFYGCLQAAERLGLKVVEIPTHPRTGIDLAALSRAIVKHPIRACWCMTTLHHPTGAIMPLSAKRDLVQLLARHQIPLLEDDAYAELQFSNTPAPPAKAFDEKGLVMHCGSFSKCLAPGYRLGWVAAGKFAQDIARLKIESSIATSLPTQLGLAQLLRYGSYDAHLQRFRRFLAAQQRGALHSLHRHLPAGYRVAQPAGGYFLWVECATKVDALEVHRQALEFGITIAPGPMFSARGDFTQFLRLNTGHLWNAVMDKAVQRLGQIIAQH